MHQRAAAIWIRALRQVREFTPALKPRKEPPGFFLGIPEPEPFGYDYCPRVDRERQQQNQDPFCDRARSQQKLEEGAGLSLSGLDQRECEANRCRQSSFSWVVACKMNSRWRLRGCQTKHLVLVSASLPLRRAQGCLSS